MNLIRNLVDQRRASEASKDPEQQVVTRPLPENENEAAETADASVETEQVETEAEKPASEIVNDVVTAIPRVKPVSKKIWEFSSDSNEEVEETQEDTTEAHEDQANVDLATPEMDEIAPADNIVQVPDPLVPQKPRQAGRVKTRLMGFASNNPLGNELFDQVGEPTPKRETKFPVGWLVVVKGLGRGEYFSLHNEVSTIGRGEDQTIVLNFGDDTVSRNNHAAIAFDDQLNACFVGHSGKANLVRLNGRPILTTEQLTNGDTIIVGQTTLMFVELCGPSFNWAATENDEDDHDIQI